MHQCEIFRCGPQAAVNTLQPRPQRFAVLIPNNVFVDMMIFRKENSYSASQLTVVKEFRHRQ